VAWGYPRQTESEVRGDGNRLLRLQAGTAAGLDRRERHQCGFLGLLSRQVGLAPYPQDGLSSAQHKAGILGEAPGKEADGASQHGDGRGHIRGARAGIYRA